MTAAQATPIVRLYDVQVNQLWEQTKELPRGELKTYAEVAAVIGFGFETTPYRTITRRWRDMMLARRGIYVRAVANVGFRLLTAEEQLYDESRRKEKKVGRDQRKLMATVGGISRSELDDKGQRFQAAVSVQYATEYRSRKEHQVQRQSYMSNPESMPRLPMG